MNFNPIIDALPFADFATPEEMALAQKLISEEMGNLPGSEAPLNQAGPLRQPAPSRPPLDPLTALKVESELQQIRSENLEIATQLATPAWIQLKTQLISLRERTSRSKIETEEALADSIKRRRLAQTMHAASLRQYIREWSDLLNDNGEAEKAVAKLHAEISRLVRIKKIPADLWEKINQIVAIE